LQGNISDYEKVVEEARNGWQVWADVSRIVDYFVLTLYGQRYV
jgi:hypothetical protein